MARNRQKEEETLQNVLDRFVVVLRDADPTQTKTQQVKDMEEEFLEQFLPFAKRYCSPIRRDYDEGCEIEALYEVLRTIESKCQAEQHPEIRLSYVKNALPKRYLTIRKAGRSVFTDETVSLTSHRSVPRKTTGLRILQIRTLIIPLIF